MDFNIFWNFLEFCGSVFWELWIFWICLKIFGNWEMVCLVFWEDFLELGDGEG